MAPEVCANQEFGFEADIFSAGVTLRRCMELIDGRHDHDDVSPELMRQLEEYDPSKRPTAEQALAIASKWRRF